MKSLWLFETASDPVAPASLGGFAELHCLVDRRVDLSGQALNVASTQHLENQPSENQSEADRAERPSAQFG